VALRRMASGTVPPQEIAEVVAVPVGAYNSLWQVRTDAWSSLEESTAQLALAAAQQNPVEQLAETVAGWLGVIGPFERLWAFPGTQAFLKLRRLFTGGKYDRCAALAARLNRALATDSYRGGQAFDLGAEDDLYDPLSPPSEQARADRPYFEVLVIEDMSEEQERELREELARELDAQLTDSSPAERGAHDRAVLRLTAPSAPLPDFGGFHPSFKDSGEPSTPEGDVRRAFYLAYNDSYCEYLKPDEVEQRVESGEQVVSTTYVTPYPPGFPVLVPGQVFSRQILSFMRSLDTPEVHGYRPELGYRVYVDKALEIAAATGPAAPPDGAVPLTVPAPSPSPREAVSGTEPSEG
jgi:Orn/Lys/Arg decarboxylase, C-terminal domain